MKRRGRSYRTLTVLAIVWLRPDTESVIATRSW
jgi:hypothetical protein